MVEPSERTSPRNFHFVSVGDEKARSDALVSTSHHDDMRVLRKLVENRMKKLARVNRRPEVPHILGEHFVKIV
jgi:hypothetical protein